MPVDLVASAVIQLSGVGDRGVDTLASGVYHVQNKQLFHWTRDLLPALKEAGLAFETVPQREWVEKLQKSDPNPETNPTIKLVDFFAEKYDNDRPGRSGLIFITSRAEEDSKSVRDGFDVIGSGLISRMVKWWETQW